METGRVQNKIALITGAGSGIGKATAILLAKEGATVIVADINRAAAEQVVSEIHGSGGKARVAELNVSDESAWVRAIGKIMADHDRLDILINNAGVSFAKPIAKMTLDDWRRVLAVNLDGVFLGTKYAIDAMRETGGSIVNVASVAGINTYAGASAYGSSKAAVRIFSKIAAIECADAKTRIRVNLVSPGGVKTPIWDAMSFFKDLIAHHGSREEAFTALAGSAASQEFSSPEEIARSILYLASDESSHLTGVELVIARGHAGS
jgi:NAD(P)-dependent dehydrogenase (short-subunit alcohol dehydrogenase family)